MNADEKKICVYLRLSASYLVILFVLTPFLLGCQGTNPVVKIGFVAPFEGKQRPIGYDSIYSARLAVRELNNAGGVGDYRVALVAMDDSGDSALAEDVAQSLLIDPDVVVVVGNWLPETTQASRAVFEVSDMPFVQVGRGRLGVFDPAGLPTTFHTNYEAVTPFDETAGPYAGATYDAFQLIFAAMQHAHDQSGAINRVTIANALEGLEIEGLTGIIMK